MEASRKRRVQMKVYARSEWRCEMPECYAETRDIDPGLLGYDDPWAPSIDHIIPRAEGGGNVQSNMRAAHKQCNNEAGRTVTATRVKVRDNPPRGMRVKIGDRYPDLEELARMIVRE